MFENATKSQKIKLFGSFATTALLGIIVILVVVMYLNSSLGWFSNNKQVDGEGMEVEVDYDDFYVNATYYQYDPKAERVNSSTDLSNIMFNPYDLVFRSRNRYTPIIATLEMTGSDLPENGSLTVTIGRNTSVDAATGEIGDLHLAEKFSSIMRVTPYIGASYYSSTAGTLFSNVDTLTNYEYVRTLTGNVEARGGQPQSKVFTEAVMDGGGEHITSVTKAESLVFEIDYTSSDFVDVNGVSTLIVYLYITYDEGYGIENDTTHYDGLVGIYQKTSETGSISSGGDITDTSVRFENDLTNIRVTYN